MHETKMKLIAQLVADKNGCKGSELVTELTQLFLFYDLKFSPSDLDDAVAQGYIIEVCYCLPNMLYRVKSFYLPKGTQDIVVHI